MCRRSSCRCHTKPLLTPEARTARLLAWLRNNEKVMEAYLKGEVIQAQTAAGDWHDVTIPNWRMSTQYRIKPAPLESDVWVCTAEGNSNWWVGAMQIKDTDPSYPGGSQWKKIRMREVL